MTEPKDVTLYLQQIGQGDANAVNELLPHVYEDLRCLAAKIFQDQWRSHTLQPTALVHEAYMRMVRPEESNFENRQHFLRVAAMAMRQLLTDYSRGHNAEKRGGRRDRIHLEDVDPDSGTDSTSDFDILALDEALADLHELDVRQARIVELRFLAGLTAKETAEVLEVSERTVYLDWNMARAWLERRLTAQ